MRENEVDGSVVLVAPLGGQQRGHDLVIRHVLRQLIFQPDIHLFVVLATTEGAGATQQPVGPHVRPVARVVFIVEQTVNQQRTPSRLRIFVELLELGQFGDPADDVE